MGCGASTLDDSEVAILEIGELLHDANKVAQLNPEASFQKIRQAESKLKRVDEENQDHYAILVYSREGKLQYNLRRYQLAIEAYTKAVHIAEVKIAEKVRGLYLLLQRYAECMCDIASIWLKSASIAKTQHKRLRENGKAELVLLRCVETIEEGHNRRSDLLVEPLLMLGRIYESVGMYGRAELLIRRVSGILIVTYGHEHPLINETNVHLDALIAKKDVNADEEAAIKIQSVFRMRIEMKRLEKKLGRPSKIHRFQTKANRSPTPSSDLLTQLAAETGDSESETSSRTSKAGSNPQTVVASPASASPTTKKAQPAPKAKNPLDAATKNKPFKGVMDPVLSSDQAPPRIWTVEGEEFNEDDLH